MNMKKSKQIKCALLTIHTISFSLLLSSCSGLESQNAKMTRYTPQAIEKNKVPEIKTMNFTFSKTFKTSNSRAPASKAPMDYAPKDESLNEDGPTNKKLYFLTLFNQYNDLKNFSSEQSAPDVTICPNFHTSVLTQNDEWKSKNTHTADMKKFTYDMNKLNDDTYLSTHPELLLPMSKEETTPKVVDIIRGQKTSLSDFAVNEIVHKALDIHLAKTYIEIRELCEYGVSDNYYIYENLITHINKFNFQADEKNLNILLKTTLFSNYALTTSLSKFTQTKAQGRSIASSGDFDMTAKALTKNVMTRLNVSWAQQYFDFIKDSH